MELKKLIKNIEHGNIEPVTETGTIGFYCKETDRGLPEPRHASTYETAGIQNFPYKKTPSTRHKARKITSPVTNALHTGWIIPLPTDTVIYPDETGKPTPVEGRKYQGTDHIKNYVTKQNLNTTNTIFTIDTKWAVDVPDGYSILYTPPANHTDTRFTIIPGVIDADEFPAQINVPIIPFDKEFELQSGMPLIQLHPFKRSDYNISAQTKTLEEYSQ